jgi:hypothetical protein
MACLLCLALGMTFTEANGQNADSTKTTKELPTLSKLMLLEKPGERRLVYGVGSPINFRYKGDDELVQGIITTVGPQGFIVYARQGGEIAVPYQDIEKLRIPKDGNGVGLRKVLGTVLSLAAVGYMVLYAVNPGAGNTLDPSRSEHARNSMLVSGGLAVGGLSLLYSTRDRRVYLNRGWKWRQDVTDAHYLPYMQK